MCGIVGYVGKEQAAPILLDGLSKLEYRGYDSAGIAVRDNASAIKIVKMPDMLYLALVVSDIPDGQHTVNHQRQMHILIQVMMEMLLQFITESLRTIRN